MQKLIEAGRWLARNRVKIGGVVLVLGGWLATLGHEWDSWSKLLLALGGIIGGSGVAPSDSQVRAKQEFEASGGLDRRA